MDRPKDHVTELLHAWVRGEEAAQERLLPTVYDVLRRLAGAQMRSERPGHTLQTTGLIHEAYLRLVNQQRVTFRDRNHFFSIAAQMMRRVLVDHARQRSAAKRGVAVEHVSLGAEEPVAPDRGADVMAVDEALQALGKRDPRKASIVELRYFGGFSLAETAAIVEVSEATVSREWTLAKAWLLRAMKRDGGS